jgi:hypothetical protein
MKTKQMFITMAVVLMALSLAQSASAVSVFVHNAHATVIGVDVTYTVNDHTARYIYTFHRTISADRSDIELALPAQFQPLDRVSVSMDVTSPYQLSEESGEDIFGDLGVDVWFDLADPMLSQ